MQDVSKSLWKRLRIRSGIGGNSREEFFSLSEVVDDLFVLDGISSDYVGSSGNLAVTIIARNPIDDGPVGNVELTGKLSFPRSNKETKPIFAESSTDSGGHSFLIFQIPDSVRFSDYESLKLEIEGTHKNWADRIDTTLSGKESSLKILLNSDKPIYQPGQSINLRSLFLERKGFSGNATPLTAKDVEFSIRGRDGKKIFRKKSTTNDFGIAFTSWQIPEVAKTGTYSASIEIEGYDDVGFMVFHVSRYELPEFFVKAKPDKEYYLTSQERAKINVSAEYLFGEQVQKGTVEITDFSGKSVDQGKTKNGTFIASVPLAKGIEEVKEYENVKYLDLVFLLTLLTKLRT